ncbi:TolC family protein [Oceanispirochaeta crateris]|nr:TolC family protein [Oceanispirochaeta crateris]
MEHLAPLFIILLISASAVHGLSLKTMNLDESVQLALEQNELIVNDNFERLDAWRRLHLQLRQFFPSLQLGYSATDSVTQNSPDSRIKKLSVSLSQVLFNGGRDLAAYRSSYRDLKLRDLQARDLSEEIAHEVVLQYVDVLKNIQVLEIQNRSFENLLEQIKIAALEMELGTMKESDFLEIQINAIEYSLNIKDTEEGLLQSRYALATLLYLPLEQLPPLSGQLNQDYKGDSPLFTHGTPNDISLLKTKAQEYNTDLMSLYRQESNARRALLDSRIHWIPKIEATFDYSLSAMDFPLDEPSFSLGLDFSFQTPLLPGSIGVQAGKSSRSEHNLSTDSALYIGENLEGLADSFSSGTALYSMQRRLEEMKRSIDHQVRALTHSIQLNLQRLEVTREKIRMESEKLKIEESRMNIGELTRLDYIMSEIRLANQKTELIENIVILYSNEIELEKICGMTRNRQEGTLIWYPDK